MSVVLTNTGIELPIVADYSTNNAHMFYLVCSSLEQRTALIQYLKDNEVHAVFHYLSLHTSEFYQDKYIGYPLPNSDYFTDTLVRLPLFYELTDEQVDHICMQIKRFVELK
ncbi:dTDP-4-amino-4,6-dideoxygalactose transaminase [compost metagenome]